MGYWAAPAGGVTYIRTDRDRVVEASEPFALEALGVGRARAVGTIAAGLVQRVTDGLDLFSTVSAQTGRDDHREAISTGVRLSF